MEPDSPGNIFSGPFDPEIHHMYAHYLSAMGRFDEALTESKQLLELDPLAPASRNHLGWHYLYAHEFDQAIEQYKLVLAIDPNFAEAHRQLSEAYAEQGKFDQALEEMSKRLELIGRGNEVSGLKMAYASLGWKGVWQKRLQFALERNKRFLHVSVGSCLDLCRTRRYAEDTGVAGESLPGTRSRFSLPESGSHLGQT